MIIIIIAIIGWLMALNNRYEYTNNNRIRADKWTGTVYRITDDGWEKLN